MDHPRPAARPLHLGERGPAVTRSSSEGGLSLRNLLVVRGERSFGSSGYWKHVTTLLERADLPLRAAEIVAIQGGAAFVLLLIRLHPSASASSTRS
jgi:hypothetical protein